MTYIVYVLHSADAESHAIQVVDLLRQTGHRVEAVNYDHITINALRGMPAVVLITGPKAGGIFIDALSTSPSLRLSSLIYEIRSLGGQPDTISRDIRKHLERHGGQPIRLPDCNVAGFGAWAASLSIALPKPATLEIA